MKANTLLKILAFATAMLLVSASCQKPEAPDNPAEQPEETPENPENPENPEKPETTLKPNSYLFNDTLSEYGSVAAGMFNSYLGISATTTSGKETFEEILEENNLVYVLVTAPLNGQEFDVMTETRTFTISVCLGDTMLQVAPGISEGITAGKCLFTSAGGKVEVSFELTLTDGTKFSTLMSDEAELVMNTNTISRNGEEKALNAAFYLVEDGLTSLYFTPGDVDYFDEMTDKATYYTYVILNDSKCNGTDVDASELFMCGITDNIDDNAGANSIDTKPTGTVNVKKNAEDGDYTVAIDLKFGSQTIKVSFNGKAVSAETVPARNNEYTYSGTVTALTGAVLEKSENTWTVTLTAGSGDNVSITMPASFFNGEAHGFSQSADFKVTLGSRTFSKANGDSGTATVGINEESKTLTAEFMDYKSLNVYYSGSYTIK